MTNVAVVFCTCGSEREAQRIANALIENRLAACVNILPSVRSVYRWQGAVETSDELLLIVKTTEERLPALRDHIVGIHSYQTPEVIAVPVLTGSEDYLAWVRESVRSI